MKPVSRIQLNLSLADQLRFEKAVSDMGGTAADTIKSLVRDFLRREGVKNLRGKSRIMA